MIDPLTTLIYLQILVILVFIWFVVCPILFVLIKEYLEEKKFDKTKEKWIPESCKEIGNNEENKGQES